MSHPSLANWLFIITLLLLLVQSSSTLAGMTGVNLGWIYLNRVIMSTNSEDMVRNTRDSLVDSPNALRYRVNPLEEKQPELQNAGLWLQWAVSWLPQNGSAHENLGDFHMNRGDLASAQDELTTASELASEESSIRFRFGNLLYILGQEERALQEWRAGGVLPYFLRLAQERMGQGDLDGAGFSLRLATEIAPDNPEPRYLLGDLYSIQNRREEAIAAYEEGIHLEPHDSPERLARRAQIQTWQGEWSQAIETYRAALQLAPYDAYYAYQIGRVLEEGQRDRIQAQGWYVYAIQLDAHRTSPYLALARIAQEDGQCEDALDWLRQARGVDSKVLNASELHYRVGNCHKTQGQFEMAQSHLVQAIRLEVDPLQSIPYRLALAQVHIELDDFREAIHQYREVLDLSLDNRQARRGLEELWAKP